jgi:hypothetical protein
MRETRGKKVVPPTHNPLMGGFTHTNYLTFLTIVHLVCFKNSKNIVA